MVESLKELSRFCQKPRYKEVGNWMVRYILRDLALPITWLLLHTPVTANQVTGFSLVVGLAGVIFLAFPPKAMFLAGTLLLQIWYLLDHVDGQIARYRKTVSLTGRFFDYLMHHVIHGALFFGLTFYVYQTSARPFWILWGFLTSLSMMTFNLIQDVKYKTFMDKLAGIKAFRVRAGELAGSSSSPGDQKTVRKIFSLLHKSFEIHVAMNLLTLAAFLESFGKIPFDLRVGLAVFYGVVVPVVTAAKVGYFLKNRKIDEEFSRTFQPLEPQGESGV